MKKTQKAKDSVDRAEIEWRIQGLEKDLENAEQELHLAKLRLDSARDWVDGTKRDIEKAKLNLKDLEGK